VNITKDKHRRVENGIEQMTKTKRINEKAKKHHGIRGNRKEKKEKNIVHCNK
jgi:hypothetical protein